MWLSPLLSPHAQLALIVVSAIGFDFGIQATLVAHQTVVFVTDTASRSRLNALLLTGMFVGMAGGAALGSLMLTPCGWACVVTLATTASLAALAVLAVRMLGQRKN